MPFTVRAAQIYGGSEFKAEFEGACREKRLRLFVLPQHSPKLNSCVERSHCAHEEGFYQCYTGGVPSHLRLKRPHDTSGKEALLPMY